MDRHKVSKEELLAKLGFPVLEPLPKGMTESYIAYKGDSRSVVKIAEKSEEAKYRNIKNDADALMLVSDISGIARILRYEMFSLSNASKWINLHFHTNLATQDYVMFEREYIPGTDIAGFHGIKDFEAIESFRRCILKLHERGISGLDMIEWHNDRPDHIYNLIQHQETGQPYLFDLGRCYLLEQSFKAYNQGIRKDWREFDLIVDSAYRRPNGINL
ncbi:MAG: hypothetical protein HGA85_09005 [Nanoarchaeota archaeon]|nr:hypothetical protein [Nanoarchaeota archaeon]